MIDGNLSSEDTAIAGLPFSNSMGFNHFEQIRHMSRSGVVSTTTARAVGLPTPYAQATSCNISASRSGISSMTSWPHGTS
jgi:hypothetical protein